ncbi:hypothetical protein [Shewanella sp. 8A]|uniref:hypothetical protein n=1 Tax=Shewanella sp. 8A TaxID=2943323 RepID=UPI00201B0FD5|nr:hypothetical protein [Shewanella sp. 8A]
MAFTLPTITLASGLELTNPMLVISELNVSNNSSSSERLDIIAAPGGDGEAVNQSYKILKSQNGGCGCSAIVSVFMSQAAFDAGKPPVEIFKDGRNTKVFSINLDNPDFDGMTPRQAAYAHMIALPEFAGAVLVDGVEI